MSAADVMICRIQLCHAREGARTVGVRVPKRLTAIRAARARAGGEGWWLVESREGFSQEVWAFNAFDARAKAIHKLIESAPEIQ